MHQKIPDRQKLQTRAAILAAADELSDNEIARQCGISRRTLMRWKKQPAMEQKIDEYLKCIQRHSEVRMIAERQQRITPLDIRMRELQAVIQSRANSPEMQKPEPGTGRRNPTSQGRTPDRISSWKVADI